MYSIFVFYQNGHQKITYPVQESDAFSTILSVRQSVFESRAYRSDKEVSSVTVSLRPEA